MLQNSYMGDLFNENIQDTSLAVNSRISAALLDYIFVAVVLVSFILGFGEKNGPNSYSVTGPLAIIPVVFWFCYFVVFEFIFKGTPGKKIMKLRVINLNEGHITFLQILLRRVCDIIDFFWCFGLVGIILIKNTKYNQRVGDIWAKTIVIKSPKT